MGVFFLTTSPVRVRVVIAGVLLATSSARVRVHVVVGVLCLATSPARVRVHVIVGVLCLATSPARVRVGEPVVPCFQVIALLLRASAYNFTALAASASLFMVDIELCVELGKEVLQVGRRGFSGF